MEDHADAAAQADDIERVDVLAVEQDFALDAGVANGFIHAVQGAQECGFAATGRADERGDAVGGNFEVEAEDGLLRTVVKIQIRNRQALFMLDRW